MLLTVLDILGMIFGVSGAILVGNKDYRGFMLFLIGSISHGIMGALTGSYGLMTTCIIFGIIDIYYFIRWREECL